MTKSKKTRKTRQKYEWNQKQQHFIPHASRSLLCIWIVTVALRSEEAASGRRRPRDLFLPRPGSTLVRDHEYFIPIKFHQNPSGGFGEEVENVKVYRRKTDGTL